MRLKSVNIAAFIMGVFTSPLAFSSVLSQSFYWDYPNVGELAASCTANYPLMQPLTIPRTLVADNSLNIGEVIYSWDYGNFLPNYMQLRCTPGTESETINNTAGGNYILIQFRGDSAITDGIMPTSLDGVGIRFFYKVDTTTDGSNGSVYISVNNSSESINSPVLERPVFVNTAAYSELQVRCNAALSPSSNKYLFGCDANISLRAELVKTGPISVGSLSLPGLTEYLLIKWNDGGDEAQRNSLSGDAVTLIAPACQLRNANYTVPMGDFVPLTAPRRGTNVPVNLDLECSGQVNNVNFRFEDAGTSPSIGLEKNVSLYTSQGTPVEGLEIEMRYGGERVNIDGTTEHSTGSHGQRKTVADSLPLFDSDSTANFTANYVQIGPVLSGGNGFTGAINGKVNMWVTYN